MNEEIRTLVRYRLERAFETIEEARLMLAGGHTNTYVNRLYYACFYAGSALLLLHDKSFAKHSGIRSAFHRTSPRSRPPLRIIPPKRHRDINTVDTRRRLVLSSLADLISFRSPAPCRKSIPPPKNF